MKAIIVVLFRTRVRAFFYEKEWYKFFAIECKWIIYLPKL